MLIIYLFNSLLYVEVTLRRPFKETSTSIKLLSRKIVKTPWKGHLFNEGIDREMEAKGIIIFRISDRQLILLRSTLKNED